MAKGPFSVHPQFTATRGKAQHVAIFTKLFEQHPNRCQGGMATHTDLPRWHQPANVITVGIHYRCGHNAKL